MDKQTAIELLGGSIAAAAREIDISPQAVSDWPEVLPPRIADRVQAALYRRMVGAQSAGTPEERDVAGAEERAA